MNKEIKQKWIDALRSGEYKQTTCCLRDSNGYCCLGVLCDLYSREEQDGQWEKNFHISDLARDLERYSLFGETAGLPPKVVKWAGLDSDDPFCRGIHLSSYNDGDSNIEKEQHNFKQIADLIEECL